MSLHSFFIGLSTIALSFTATADHHFRQSEAHQHGVVSWHIAQADHEVMIEIHAPGSDLVGFEHAPKNDVQQKLINQSLDALAAPAQLLQFNAEAKCQLEEESISQTLGGLTKNEEHHDHDKHHNHDKHHGHEDHHDHHEGHHKHHDDHAKHASHEAHSNHDEHGEFSAQYTFHCDQPKLLKSIKTSWFNTFKNTKTIKVEAISDQGIQSLNLNAAMTEFKF